MDLEICKTLANELLKLHNLVGWEFEFDNSKHRFGCCHCSEKKISLSRNLVLLNDEAKVKDTILHEIAHALLPSKYHHNFLWKEKCIEIGCAPKRCYDNKDVNVPKGCYVLYCPNCKNEHRQFKHPHEGVACGKCCKDFNNGRYSEKFKLSWRYDNDV